MADGRTRVDMFLVPRLGKTFDLEYVNRPEVDAIVDAFDHLRRHAIAFIEGGPGVGKTWLMIKAAQALRRRFRTIRYVRGSQLEGREQSELVLRALASFKQPLLIVDGADEARTGVIEFLAKFQIRDEVFVAVTSRKSWEQSERLAAVIARASFGTFRVNVENFALGQSAELTQKILGVRPKRLEVEQLHERFQGNPALMTVALHAVRSKAVSWAEALGPRAPIQTTGLLGPDGRPLSARSREYQTIAADVRGVSLEVLQKLAKKPEDLYKLSPRLFEEVVTEIFHRKGYEVTLTPASRDGGKDIYAVKNDSGVTFLTLIECKHYAPDNPVGVELIRSLYGVVEEEKASAGILATTSYFTRGAKEFQHKVRFRIGLQDFTGLQKLLQDVTKN